MQLNFSGIFKVLCFDKFGKIKWEEIFNNCITTEGLNDALDVLFSAGAQKTVWYIGLKGSSETPLITWTAVNIGTDFTEFVDYSESVRQTWQEAGVSSKQITNSASPAEFNINASGTVYGGFLCSSNVKNGTSGVLWCCENFSVSRSVISGDIIKVSYTVNVSSS